MLPWKFLLKWCVEVAMENAVKFLVKFCCSSFLRKRSLKVPRFFTTNFMPFFTRRFAAANAQFRGVFLSVDFVPWILNTNLCSLMLVLRSCLPGTDSISGLRPEMGKNRKNVDFSLPQKIGKNWPKNRKKCPKMGEYWVWGLLSYFSANFAYFPRKAVTYIFPIFPHFWPEARNGVWTLYQVNRIPLIYFKINSKNSWCSAIQDLKAKWRCACWHLRTIYAM